MKYSSLYDLIRFVERGTRLHIGVLFFGSFGGDALRLPHSQTIHDCPVCWEFKNREGGMHRCLACRQRAIEKGLCERRAFGGRCINGVYEYVHPVVIDGECAALIFIGNMRRQNAEARLVHRLGERSDLIQTMEDSFDDEACRALSSLLESYIRMLAEEQKKQPSNKTTPLIDNVKAYVGENLECSVSLSDAARLFHYHEQYLGRLFKRETGMRFSDYINAERIHRAAAHLASGTSVIEAAYQVGFRNVTYFNRIFKRIYGKTPTEYKKQKKPENE